LLHISSTNSSFFVWVHLWQTGANEPSWIVAIASTALIIQLFQWPFVLFVNSTQKFNPEIACGP
jgi:hypothetical protein